MVLTGRRPIADTGTMHSVGVVVAIVRSAGGATIDMEQLRQMPGATLMRAEVTRVRRSACAALVVKYEGSRAAWLANLRRWASARDWIVTVAPRQSPD